MSMSMSMRLTMRSILPSLRRQIGTRRLSSAQSSTDSQYLNAATAPTAQSVGVFPSLVIGANGSIVPQGPFAEAQAQYLDPDPDAVEHLGRSLIEANMGVVAHYYMDVELQGILSSVQRSSPELQSRIGVADSLKMGDMAVEMCENNNVNGIVCLGVDFMSESVQAILTKNGFGHVPVYRATARTIGCSLAESAEQNSYRAWLETSKQGRQALHVVYINTSLETKAVSSAIVPTITCTSSNVLQTMLQASAQVGPDLKILYGPDTYMGNNLVTFFDTILDHHTSDSSSGTWTDERIARELHPGHTRETLQQLRDNIDVFPHGNCVVHHMFGNEVVDTVRSHYQDAFVTAHLEVPGEMFQIAMEKSLEGKGTTGSTSDILRFISKKVEEAAAQGGSERLRFILGTEAGMVTSIVNSVQEILGRHKDSQVEAEIIFPVASEAVMGVEGDDNLAIVPGVGGGEGCSTAGGCATCPFMKMNDIDALRDIIDMASTQQGEVKLRGHLPPDRLRSKMIGERPAIELGVDPIMYMRHFMQNKSMHPELIDKVTAGS